MQDTIKFKKLLKHARNYFSASVLNILLGFVSIPVLTHLVDPSSYGAYFLFLSYAAIFGVLFTLNSNASISRYWYEESADIRTFVGTSIVLSSISILLFYTFLYLFLDDINKYLDITNLFFILLLPVTFISLIQSVFFQINVVLKKSILVSIMKVIQKYSIFIITVAFLLTTSCDKLDIMLFSYVGVSLFVTLAMLYYIREHIKIAFDMQSIKYILNYSIALIPYTLGGIFLAQIDRVMLSTFLGMDSVGIYSFAYALANFLLVVTTALLTAWTPEYFEDIKENNNKKIKSDITRILTIIMAIAIMMVFIMEPVGKLLGNPSYHSGLSNITYFILGLTFFVVFSLYARNIGYEKRTGWLSTIAVCSALVNISLNYYLIPLYGMQGAAIATLLSYFCMAFGAFLVNKFIILYEDNILHTFSKYFLILIIAVLLKTVLCI